MTAADARPDSKPNRHRSMLGHISFGVEDLARASAFYDAARAPLGLRAHYGPSYYAAIMADPDGYKLEAVHQ